MKQDETAEFILLFVSLVVSLCSGELAGELARSLSSYGQLTTSSSVGWVEAGRLTGERLVTIRAGNTGVCRQRRGHLVEPGSFQGGVCTLLEGDRLEDNFQVLVDLYGLARLEWRHWDMFTGLSVGSLSYQAGSYVASTHLNSSTLVGDLRPARALSGDITVWAGNQTVTSREGEVLLELEPLRYQIDEVSLVSQGRVSTTEVVTVANISLQNDGEEAREVSAEVNFRWNSTKYWGRVDGMVRGLQTLVMGDHTVWGVSRETSVSDWLTVSRHLSPGTEIKLTASISVVRSRTPYSGLLTAVYRDGQTSRHNISAVMEETILDRLSLSPDSTSTTTVSTTTTRSTAPTTTAEIPRKSPKRQTVKLKKIFKKSLQSANLIQPRSSKQERRNTVNPLRIFYPVTDHVTIDKFSKEKNNSNKSFSTNFNLLIILFCSSNVMFTYNI